MDLGVFKGEDYQKVMDSLKGQWLEFKKAADGNIDHKTFHAINQRLGWNLAKAVPALIMDVETNQRLADNLTSANDVLRKAAIKHEVISKALGTEMRWVREMYKFDHQGMEIPRA